MACLHPLHELSASLDGLRCRACRAEIGGDYAHTVLLWGVEGALQALDSRVEKVEKALAELGLLGCERCGEWMRPADWRCFHAKTDGGDLVLCPDCIGASLEDEDDDRLFDPKQDAYRPEVVAALCRFAHRLQARPEGAPERHFARRIISTFPEEWRAFCAALP